MVLVLQVLRRQSPVSLAGLENQLNALEKNQQRLEQTLRDDLTQGRAEALQHARSGREEFSGTLKAHGDSLLARLSEATSLQLQQLEKVRGAVEQKLQQIQQDNTQKLEQMRATVDEKLHATLEKRLGESFKLVSERLEQVHKGLGEMQTLASGVGDLKRVLTNVKVRGTWGEIQLGTLLEQMLAPEQYERNVAVVPGSNERVEFAVRLPGGHGSDQPMWLPIDAKFPQENFLRLLEAQEQANPDLVEKAASQLEQNIKTEAKKIREKYISPPHTSDFALLFLPTEGLFAEVLRRPGLFELLQNQFRVTVAGPTTLSAILNSLQMGFRTLTIEKRSSEVWSLLGTVKNEFGKFGDILEKTHKKLQEASNTLDDATKKTRTIEQKLKNVQLLPTAQTEELLVNTGQSSPVNV